MRDAHSAGGVASMAVVGVAPEEPGGASLSGWGLGAASSELSSAEASWAALRGGAGGPGRGGEGDPRGGRTPS